MSLDQAAALKGHIHLHSSMLLRDSLYESHHLATST
jgi:hypothetical protein